MSWLKLDDQTHQHPKWRAFRLEHPRLYATAFGVYTTALLLSARDFTDGEVHLTDLSSVTCMPRTSLARVTAALRDAGLVTVDGAVLTIVNFCKHNKTRAERKEEQRAWREAKRANRTRTGHEPDTNRTRTGQQPDSRSEQYPELEYQCPTENPAVPVPIPVPSKEYVCCVEAAGAVEKEAEGLSPSKLEEQVSKLGLGAIAPKYWPAISELCRDNRVSPSAVDYAHKQTIEVTQAEGRRPNAGLFCTILIAECRKPVAPIAAHIVPAHRVRRAEPQTWSARQTDEQYRLFMAHVAAGR